MAISALEARRTIRAYDDSYVIPQEDLDKIIHAALISPTALHHKAFTGKITT